MKEKCHTLAKETKLIQSKIILINLLIFTTGCLGQCLLAPVEAIIVPISNVQDGQNPLDENDITLGVLQHDPDTLSYVDANLGLAIYTGSQLLLTTLISTDLNRFINTTNSSSPDKEVLVDVDFGKERISHQLGAVKPKHPSTRELAKTEKTLTTSSWKMSALPLVGATLAFSGGVWLKRNRAEKSLVALEEVPETKQD